MSVQWMMQKWMNKTCECCTSLLLFLVRLTSMIGVGGVACFDVQDVPVVTMIAVTSERALVVEAMVLSRVDSKSE